MAVADWSSTGCAIASSSAQYKVGAKSMRIISSATSWTISTTLAMGNLSAYTGVSTGHPSSGTVGLWIYCTANTDITAISLRIGSSSGNYTVVSGVKPYTLSTGTAAGFTCRAGWNYYVFILKNGTETGTPNWASVAYAYVAFTGTNGVTNYADYLTIGTGDSIGLNGLGERYETDGYSTLATG